MKKTIANNIFGGFRLLRVLMLIFFLGLSFISGGWLVYSGIARTIKDSIDNQMHLFMFGVVVFFCLDWRVSPFGTKKLTLGPEDLFGQRKRRCSSKLDIGKIEFANDRPKMNSNVNPTSWC